MRLSAQASDNNRDENAIHNNPVKSSSPRAVRFTSLATTGFDSVLQEASSHPRQIPVELSALEAVTMLLCAKQGSWVCGEQLGEEGEYKKTSSGQDCTVHLGRWLIVT